MIGHQQEWMINQQHKMWGEGDVYREKHKDKSVLNTKAKYPIYSLKLKRKLLAESAKKSNSDLNYKKMVNKVENIKIGDDDNGNTMIPHVSEDEENKNLVEDQIEEDTHEPVTEEEKSSQNKVLTQGDKLNQMKARKQQTQSLGPTNVENLIGYSRAKSVPSGVKVKPAGAPTTGKTTTRRAAATATAVPQRLHTRASSKAAAAAAAATTSPASSSRKTSAVR